MQEAELTYAVKCSQRPNLPFLNRTWEVTWEVHGPYLTEMRYLVWNMGAQKNDERVSESLGCVSPPLQCLAKRFISPCGEHEAICPSPL